MLDGLLYPLRLPERALDALGRLVQDLGRLREELASGLGTLEQTTASLAADLRPLGTDVGVVRDSASRLAEGVAKLEQTVTGLGAKLDPLDQRVGALHDDMRELCDHVEGLGKQLAAMQQTVDGIQGDVEEVTKDLPGASGSGLVARVRDALGGDSS